MKIKGFLTFKPKLPKPKLSKPNCSSVFSIFALKLNGRCFSLKRPRFRRRRFSTKFKKRFSVKALRLPKCHIKKPSFKLKRPVRRRRRTRSKGNKNPAPNADRFGEKVAELLAVSGSTRRSEELDRTMDLKVDYTEVIKVAEKDHNLDAPIPIVHGYATSDTNVMDKKVETGDEVDQLVCRSFEKYVAEMIVEEGKVKDLSDVEELLYCWGNLKSPVFVDLVGRFYGELCEDLFYVDEEGKLTTSSSAITTTTTTTSTSTSDE